MINITVSYQNSVYQQINQGMKENPTDNDKPLDVNTAAYGCYDFLVANNKIYALLSNWLDIWDISNPSKPTETRLHGIADLPQTITKNETIILFAEGNTQNSTLYTIQQDDDENNITKAANLDFYIQKMILENEILYSIGWTNETKVFAICNATDTNNVQLLGSTNISYYIGYYLYNNHIPDFYLINENNIFFITMEGNLDIYQVNNTYQLSLVKTYNFTDLRNLYFTDEYLFTCDSNGLRIYNYSNIENLVLVKQYNIPSTRSAQIRNEVAYLITDRQFLTLDISNFEDIKILDQYFLNKREPIDLMKILLEENLAVVITERKDTGAAGYMGYLYIFDISTPSKIKRIYPERIPLNPYGFWVIAFDIFMIYVAPAIIIAVAFITIFVVVHERKRKKKKTTNKSTNNEKSP